MPENQMLIHEKVAMRDVLKKRRRQLMLAAALSLERNSSDSGV